MCGIAGIYNFGGSRAPEKAISRMNDKMLHRGPDAGGDFCHGPIVLGHRRLSIIDLSPLGNQPAFSADGRYVCVFNGEIYNFREVRATIADHSFKSSGDTEVLVEGWARWGLDLLPRLKGMFAFAMYDLQNNELFLVRDRLGVKPVYYSIQNDQIYFGSEIRTVLAGSGQRLDIHEPALYSFFTYQSVWGGDTIAKDVSELKAGHYLRIKNNKVAIMPYWSATQPSVQYMGESYTDVKKKIRLLLRQAVEQRLVSDVPVGAFLSGGIDSSAIVGLMAEVSNRPPETFNISFNEEAYDESSYAKLVAVRFGARHHTILQEPSTILDNLVPALDAMDTPSADGINSFVVSKAIREAGITVALSGIGGDELFAGYPFFRKYERWRHWEKVWSLTNPLRHLAAAAMRGNDSRKDRVRQFLKLQPGDIEGFYSITRQILPPMLLSELTNIKTGGAGFLELQSYPEINKYPIYSQVSLADLLGYTQYTLLKDTDQMSMAVSLEVREPFFDHELVEYVLQVPDRFKHPHYPKKLLVESLDGLLPDEIVFRKKQGFVFPWENWMRNDLRVFCDERIKSMASRSFIKEAALINWWKKFLKGDPSIRWTEPWLFVILEHWLQKNESR